MQDLTPPTIVLPADVVLPCGSEFVYPPASATDNCTAEEDITLTTFNSLPPTDCPQERILERRFLATDLCGNSTLEIQTVTVTDNDLPFFTYVPADTSFSCDEEPMLEDAVATDDCSSFQITTTTAVCGREGANAGELTWAISVDERFRHGEGCRAAIVCGEYSGQGIQLFEFHRTIQGVVVGKVLKERSGVVGDVNRALDLVKTLQVAHEILHHDIVVRRADGRGFCTRCELQG